jgi:hypothetical protein
MISNHEVWTSFSSSGNRADHMGSLGQAKLNSGRKLFYVFSRANRCSAAYSAKFNFSGQENFQAVPENKIIYLNVLAKW